MQVAREREAVGGDVRDLAAADEAELETLEQSVRRDDDTQRRTVHLVRREAEGIRGDAVQRAQRMRCGLRRVDDHGATASLHVGDERSQVLRERAGDVVHRGHDDEGVGQVGAAEVDRAVGGAVDEFARNTQPPRGGHRREEHRVVLVVGRDDARVAARRQLLQQQPQPHRGVQGERTRVAAGGQPERGDRRCANRVDAYLPRSPQAPYSVKYAVMASSTGCGRSDWHAASR